ncbi:MAG: DUF5820 family protein [Halobacteriales archaeon]|nr:DUF5820 family protein [Halobacteriales archaeon]
MERPTEHAGRKLPEGWVVWSEDDGLVVCYKPDVFDGDDYPCPCLPLITVTKADRGTVGGREGWHVTFHVEADVPAHSLRKTVAGYDEAVDYVVKTATKFNEGVYDPAEFYAEGDVREEYVARLREETDG